MFQVRITCITGKINLNYIRGRVPSSFEWCSDIVGICQCKVNDFLSVHSVRSIDGPSSLVFGSVNII